MIIIYQTQFSLLSVQFMSINSWYFLLTGAGVAAAGWWWGLWHYVPAANPGPGEDWRVR